MSISAIAKAQQLDRQTVRSWLRADGFPERAPRFPVPGKLTLYLAYLRSGGTEDATRARYCFVKLPVGDIGAEPAFCASSLPTGAVHNRLLAPRCKGRYHHRTA
jgi:hypothetical protein